MYVGRFRQYRFPIPTYWRGGDIKAARATTTRSTSFKNETARILMIKGKAIMGETERKPSQEGEALHDSRWRPVNALKNSRLTIQIHCADSGKRFNVPSVPIQSTGNLVNYFDEAPSDHILGSTTLQELVKRVKKDIPALYLWDEVGGATLTCGPNSAHQSDWDTTMVCELICEDKAAKNKGVIPHVVLDDGREATVVTVGTPAIQHKVRRSVVDRCLSKGDVYG